MDEDFSDAPPTIMIGAEFSSVPSISTHTEWFWMMSENTPKRVWQALQSPDWNYLQVYHQISFVKQPNQIPTYKKETYGPPTFNIPFRIPTKKRYGFSPHGNPTTRLNRQPSPPQDFPKQSQSQSLAKSPEEAERNNKLGHNSTPKVTMSMPPSGAHGNGVLQKKSDTPGTTTTDLEKSKWKRKTFGFI